MLQLHYLVTMLSATFNNIAIEMGVFVLQLQSVWDVNDFCLARIHKKKKKQRRALHSSVRVCELEHYAICLIQLIGFASLYLSMWWKSMQHSVEWSRVSAVPRTRAQ